MHDVIDQLKPIQGEILIDKPGKGSFKNISPLSICLFKVIRRCILRH